MIKQKYILVNGSKNGLFIQIKLKKQIVSMIEYFYFYLIIMHYLDTPFGQLL